MEQNRFRSPVVWAAVVVQLLSVLMILGVIGEDMSDAVRTVTAGVIHLLVLFGVLNNPTDREGF